MKSRIRSIAARLLVIGAAVVALGYIANAQKPPSEAQQNPPPAQKNEDVIDLHPLLPRHPPGVVGILTLDLAQIDAVVTWKDGGFVDGLGFQNFTLEEDGRLQKIDRIDHFDTREAEAEKAQGAPTVIALNADIYPEKILPIALNHRMIVLYFDLATLIPEEMKRSIDAAKQFVKEQMTAADLVAVVSFGTELRVKSGFTNDRGALEECISALMPSKESGMQLGDSLPEDMKDFSGPQEDNTDIFNSDEELYAIKALANRLGMIPGRKSVIEFTGGIEPLTDQNKSLLRTAINAAAMNTVLLYEVDTRKAAASNSAVQAGGSPAGKAQFEAWQDSRKVLASLAQETSGGLFTDVTDFAPVFRRVQEESRDYYLLSYFSSNTARDGAFRKVTVKLEKVRGAQVKSRLGYFAHASSEQIWRQQ
jgi:VWFA-related protein